MDPTPQGFENLAAAWGVLPEVGSVWEWEPLKDHARCTVEVTDLRWNGEEWWVTSRDVSSDETALNSLDRWVEATVLIRSVEGGE